MLLVFLCHFSLVDVVDYKTIPIKWFLLQIDYFLICLDNPHSFCASSLNGHFTLATSQTL